LRSLVFRLRFLLERRWLANACARLTFPVPVLFNLLAALFLVLIFGIVIFLTEATLKGSHYVKYLICFY